MSRFRAFSAPGLALPHSPASVPEGTEIASVDGQSLQQRQLSQPTMAPPCLLVHLHCNGLNRHASVPEPRLGEISGANLVVCKSTRLWTAQLFLNGLLGCTPSCSVSAQLALCKCWVSGQGHFRQRPLAGIQPRACNLTASDVLVASIDGPWQPECKQTWCKQKVFRARLSGSFFAAAHLQNSSNSTLPPPFASLGSSKGRMP